MTGSSFQDPANVGRMISLTNTLNEGDKYLMFVKKRGKKLSYYHINTSSFKYSFNARIFFIFHLTQMLFVQLQNGNETQFIAIFAYL